MSNTTTQEFPFIFVGGNNVTPGTPPPSLDTLPDGFYHMRADMERGYFLSPSEPCSLPPKIYGPVEKQANRILSAHRKLGKGMGVLLSGTKGAGKTVLARMVCLKSPKVLVVSDVFGGSGFIKFLDRLPPMTIFIDEFEKIFRETEDRDSFLAVLDGTASSKHLFILTSNTDQVSEFMINRPGRLRYHLKFDNLSYEIMSEIIDDLVPEDSKPELNASIKQYAFGAPNLSMDGLTAICHEAMMFDQKPTEFMPFFNVVGEDNSSLDYYLTISMPRFRWQGDGGYQRQGGERYTPEQQDLIQDLKSSISDCFNYGNTKTLADFVEKYSEDIIWKDVEFRKLSTKRALCPAEHPGMWELRLNSLSPPLDVVGDYYNIDLHLFSEGHNLSRSNQCIVEHSRDRGEITIKVQLPYFGEHTVAGRPYSTGAPSATNYSM